MKPHIPFTPLILALLLWLLTPVVPLSLPQAAAAQFTHFEVVDLCAELAEDGHIIHVSGGIKNKSFSSVRGCAVLYLLDGNDAVVHAVETVVNDRHLFHHGQTATFQVTIDISALKNLQSVTVEFVQQS